MILQQIIISDLRAILVTKQEARLHWVQMIKNEWQFAKEAGKFSVGHEEGAEIAVSAK